MVRQISWQNTPLQALPRPLLDEKYFFRVAGPYDAPTCWKISSDYNLSILVDDTNSAHVLYALVF